MQDNYKTPLMQILDFISPPQFTPSPNQGMFMEENNLKLTNPAEDNPDHFPTEKIIIPGKVEASGEPAKLAEESIRVKVSLLNRMMSLAGELVLVRNQQMQLVDRSNPALNSNTHKLDTVTTSLQECIMKTRMQPVGSVFGKFNRIVRDLSKELQKNIQLHISGDEVELDKTILESLSDPLTHMIRNACDHGVETPEQRRLAGKPEQGNIYLSARHEGGHVLIEMTDDGKGIHQEVVKAKALQKGIKTKAELELLSEQEILNLVLLPGFSTAQQVTDFSGRGVGMDVVKTNIEKSGGNLVLESTEGKGTSVILRLPLTLAIIPCLVVRVDGLNFAIPQVNLEELVTLYNREVFEKIEAVRGQEVFRLRDNLLQMVRLGEVLRHEKPMLQADQQRVAEIYEAQQREFYKEENKAKLVRQSLTFAVLKAGNLRYGLIIDDIHGTEEVVVKSMHPYLQHLTCYAGATVMGDGKIAQILDINGLAKYAGVTMIQQANSSKEKKQVKELQNNRRNILLFQYGKEERFALLLSQIARIERIKLEEISHVGPQEFVTIDGASIKILRMESYLNISTFEPQKHAFLVIPKQAIHPVGLLISRILDSLEAEINLEVDRFNEPGLMGSALIDNQLTLFVDFQELQNLESAKQSLAVDIA